MKRFFAICLLAAFCIGLSACAANVNASTAKELTPKGASIQPGDAALSQDFYAQQNALSWKFFASALEQSQGENVLVSPLSIQVALCMTANGADGSTLKEMEALFCGEYSIEEMNQHLTSYLFSLPSEEKARLHIANSIWYRGGEDPIDIKEEFLNSCAYYYGAQAYQAPFDSQTIKDINGWVSDNTDGMIQKLIDQLGADAAMVLINALCFDAKWQSIYDASDIQPGTFTALDGSEQEAQFMFSQEYSYLYLPDATGFVKNYAGGSYKFAALLPDEGVDIYEFVKNLSPEDVFTELNNSRGYTVMAYLPKFSCEYSLNMNQLLCDLGMPSAFDGNLADFSKMSDTALCISDVIHKTKITVDENGTKAAAATAVIVRECSAMIPDNYKTVRLDRPFVYMILDSNNVPIFIGIQASMD